jgi:HEAT repeat protein
LGHFSADGAVEPLTELLNRRPDPNAELLEGLPWENDRIQSAIALGKIANRDSSEVLIKALDDEHQWIRAGTAQGLVHFVDDCRGWPTELTKPLSLAFHQDECEDVRKYSRIALAKIITRTYYNFSQAQSEIFGDIAEGLADKIFDEHVLDKNLREGLKWLGEHGYR